MKARLHGLRDKKKPLPEPQESAPPLRNPTEGLTSTPGDYILPEGQSTTESHAGCLVRGERGKRNVWGSKPFSGMAPL
jgi:hypothetical protein